MVIVKGVLLQIPLVLQVAVGVRFVEIRTFLIGKLISLTLLLSALSIQLVAIGVGLLWSSRALLILTS
jgi:hypothetical protein